MGKFIFDIATWLIPLTFAIVFHEVAHGRVAQIFGDQTASEQGRLSLNPLRHVDPFGTVMLPLILALTGAPIFGWAKPVPVNSARLRNPRWHMAIVAAAGPASNIVLAVLAGLVVGLVSHNATAGHPAPVITFILTNLVNFIAINLFLAVFNMIPIPPFDGSKVLAGFLPPVIAEKFRRLDRYALPFMMILLVVLPQIAPSANIIARVVVPPVTWMFSVISQLF